MYGDLNEQIFTVSLLLTDESSLALKERIDNISKNKSIPPRLYKTIAVKESINNFYDFLTLVKTEKDFKVEFDEKITEDAKTVKIPINSNDIRLLSECMKILKKYNYKNVNYHNLINFSLIYF